MDGWLWVLVIAITPLQQLLYELVSSQVRILPAAAAILSLFLGRVARHRLQGLFLVSAILILAAGFISGENSNTGDSMTVAASFAVLIALVPAALQFQVRHYGSFVKYSVAAVLLVQTASSAAGVAQLAGAEFFGVGAREGRVNGLAYHPNVLGLMAALAVLVLLDLIRRRAINRLVLFIALAINGFALILTASLSSALTLAAGLAFFLVRLSGRARVIAILGAIAVVLMGLVASGWNLVTLLPDAFSERVSDVTAAEDGDVGSLVIRFQTYEWAWASISSDPLVGVGMDASNQGTITDSLVVHNYLLRGWYQGGVLLFAALVSLSVGLVSLAVRSMKFTDYTAPAAVVMALLVFAMTSAFYTQSSYWLPILIAVAFMTQRLPADGVVNRRTTTWREP